MATYTARAIRSGDWWAIEIDEIDGVHTQARRLDQVEAMARDAIALMLDVAPGSFDIDVRPELRAEWAGDLNQAAAIRRAAEILSHMASRKMIQTVRRLHDEERLPMRDIGRILGMSHQRVHQLLSAPASDLDSALFYDFADCVDLDRLEKIGDTLGNRAS
jgi:predicted RNase H-like HicB family nuclease